MNNSVWKTLAIIFITLFILETSIVMGLIYLGVKDEQKTEECYYDICANYPDAERNGNVCTCYDLDLYGEYIVGKEELMR